MKKHKVFSAEELIHMELVNWDDLKKDIDIFSENKRRDSTKR